MKCFEARLRESGFTQVTYLEYNKVKDVSYNKLLLNVSDSFKYYHTMDNLLEAKMTRCKSVRLEIVKDSPMFLYTSDELSDYMKHTRTNPFFQTSFYRHFREHKGILINKNGGYTGGKLTFDSENRLKIPKGTKLVGAFPQIKSNLRSFWEEAMVYVDSNFVENPGDLSVVKSIISGKLDGYFAIDHFSADEHAQKFLDERLKGFGPYQDAFLKTQTQQKQAQLMSGTLFHSCISPYLNNGLLTPEEVVEMVLEYKDRVPIQSLEGFIRQLIGWREFVRLVYNERGAEMRLANALGNIKLLDNRWYKGELGVPPVDDAIRYAFKFGYLHHILRLMVVANFMNLSRIHPDEIYRWFMDFSLDAYDWVMIGNVYGMATFASPIMSTKPYISGSNYILRMSDYTKDKWCEIWDGLFYRFLDANLVIFKENGRMNMMLANLNRKDPDVRKRLFAEADKWLSCLPNHGKRSAVE